MSYTTLSLNKTRWTIARTVALGGGEIAADSATLTDANIPPESALNCTGFDSIFVRPLITAGTNPTLTIEPLFYDADAADGARWQRVLLGAPPGVTPTALAIQVTPALLNGQMVEIFTLGWAKVFLRVTAVSNKTSTTAGKILAIAGRTRQIPITR